MTADRFARRTATAPRRRANGPKRPFVVETHLGRETTWATSPEKAIVNVRYRLFGRCADARTILYWTAHEAQPATAQ